MNNIKIYTKENDPENYYFEFGGSTKKISKKKYNKKKLKK